MEKGDLTEERADEVKQLFLAKHHHQFQMANPTGGQSLNRPACLKPNQSPAHHTSRQQEDGAKKRERRFSITSKVWPKVELFVRLLQVTLF